MSTPPPPSVGIVIVVGIAIGVVGRKVENKFWNQRQGRIYKWRVMEQSVGILYGQHSTSRRVRMQYTMNSESRIGSHF